MQISSNECVRTAYQFLLLTHKNFILQFRRPVGTVVELVLPVCGVIFIVVIRHYLNFAREIQCFTTYESDFLELPNWNSRRILYTPQTEDTKAIINIFREDLGAYKSDYSIEPVASENEMVKEWVRMGYSFTSCFGIAGLVFNRLHGNDIIYTIRLPAKVVETLSIQTIVDSTSDKIPGPRSRNIFLSRGFVQLQRMIGNAILKWEALKANVSYQNIKINVRQLPYPEYSVDKFLVYIDIVLPLLLVLTFLYTAGTFVRELVQEKETRVREYMLMMGLKQTLLWATWFIKQFLFLLLPVIAITTLLKVSIFTKSDWLVLLVFSLCFISSMIAFSFFVSVWFSNAKAGLIAGLAAWFTNFFPFFFLMMRYQKTHFGIIFLSCLLSNTAFGFGVEIFIQREQQGLGVRWSNIMDELTLDKAFNIVWVMSMLLIDSAIYLALAWYVNEVKPGKYGVPKPFYFPVLRSYWWDTPPAQMCHRVPEKLQNSCCATDPSAHEAVSGKLTMGIKIRNLTKTYSSRFGRKGARKNAICDLNLDIYKNQITALLGHNGAGKTTTISILTGLISPSDGTVVINGHNIRTEMGEIRRSLGICPQHNILFDRLTVKEHLLFFIRLKGIGGASIIKYEIDQILKDLMLADKKDTYAGHLSGGMKRKLSLAIALIGDSEVVILDEPTAGMDPYTRRATWDLLDKHKKTRCILLSTHFMDEADLLSDRIAILVEGRLQCSGSSLFLKSKYGIGYHMTLIKDSHCITSVIENLVKSIIPFAEMKTDLGMELCFILPVNLTSKFSSLFEILENNKTHLGIASLGISNTTMEEVFIKVTEIANSKLNPPSEDYNPRVSIKLKQHFLKHGEHRQSARSTKGTSLLKTGSVSKNESVLIQHIQESSTREKKIVNRNSSPTESSQQNGDKEEEIEPVIEPKVEELRKETNKNTVVLYDEGLDSTTENDNKDNTNFGLTIWKKNIVYLPSIESSSKNHSKSSTKRYARRNQITSVTSELTGKKPLPPINNREGGPKVREIDLSQTNSSGQHHCTNQGVLLWVQKFKAMFVKRLLCSVRLYRFVIFQLVFPLVSSILGLLIIMYSNDTTDAESIVSISSNNFDRRNTTFFFAELDGWSLNLSEYSLEDMHISNFFNITADVYQLKNSIQRINNLRECCNYPFQILDQYCASRKSSDLTHCKDLNSSFGYSTCLSCLICCSAVNSIDSCSSRIVYNTKRTFCPSPPSLSLHSSLGGPLDTINTFVTEFILRLAKKVSPVRFFQRYQAGYTIGTQDPLFSGCDCSRTNGQSTYGCSILSDYMPTECSSNSSCVKYNFGVNDHCNQQKRNLCNLNSTCYTLDPNTRLSIHKSLCVPYGSRCDHFHGTLMGLGRPICKVHPEVLPIPAVTLWYNNAENHIVPSALNVYHILRLRQIMGTNDIAMKVIHHPLPRILTGKSHIALQDFLGYLLAILISFGYSFFLANFVVFLVRENESKSKHLQFVSGVSATSYWFSALAWDIISAIFPVILTVVVFRSFSVKAYRGNALVALFLVLCLTCWAGIPFTYITSFMFSNSLIAFTFLVVVFFILTTLLLIAIFLIRVSNVGNKEDIVDTLHHIFLCSPTYGLAATINDIYTNQHIKEYCLQHKHTCQRHQIEYGNDSVIYQHLEIGNTCIYLTVQGFLYIAITMLLEVKFCYTNILYFFSRMKTCSTTKTLETLGEDEDVQTERERVLNEEFQDEVVVIKNLVKVYNQNMCVKCRPPKMAVAGITLGITSGECFGLLGLNGAGKTTIFKILTGDITMTSGMATISENNIQTSLNKARQNLGYCPQFSALIGCLTAREHLWMFARLRGIPEFKIKEKVEAELQRLDLAKYADVRCSIYSEGVRRKLSTAIAIVGSPAIVLMDEPTTGMDPKTRHYLWDVLNSITREGRSIILSSHSMEECEALCTRLAIMINGQFRCLGSVQHLKDKFGSGVTLVAKIRHNLINSSDPSEVHRKSRALSMPANKLEFRNLARQRKRLFSMHQRRDQNVNRNYAITKTARSSISTSSVYDTAAMHQFIEENFENSVLIEEHLGSVTYWLPSNEISWSCMFRLLEDYKDRLNITDYSVSQTTLEQVFLRFAREQEDTFIDAS